MIRSALIAISFNERLPRLPKEETGSLFSSFSVTTGSFISIVIFFSSITGELATGVFSVSSVATKSKVICDKGFSMQVKVRCLLSSLNRPGYNVEKRKASDHQLLVTDKRILLLVAHNSKPAACY